MLIIGIYLLGDLILFSMQSTVNMIVMDVKGPWYLLGLVGSPSEDYIDVDYFTIQDIRHGLLWEDSKDVFK